MTSDFPTPASSQQPFARPHPQPAPVQAALQAASPPSKQSLKSWWKTFRPPAKNQETHGKTPSWSQLFTPFRAYCPQQASHPSVELPEDLQGHFYEHRMDQTTPARDGYMLGGNKYPESISKAPSRRRSFAESLWPGRQEPDEQAPRQSSASLFKAPLQRLRQERSKSMIFQRAVAPSSKRNMFGEDYGGSFAAHFDGPTNDTLAAGILPGPKRRPRASIFDFLSRVAPSESKSSPEKNKAKTEKTAQPETGIFGVPLRQSITYANVAISLVDGEGKSYIYGYVPIVVAKCGVYLKEKATNVEGIFRLSGSEKRIKELRTIFDSPDRYGKGLDWAGYTVHDAANVLRRYLNQLPEPIVPLDLYDRFRAPLKGHTMQAVGDTEGPQLPDNFDIRGAIETYQQLITELPPLNRQLLLYILDLLAVFASKSDENRMTSQNLAAIFQPGMLSHPSHDMAPSEYRLSQDVLIFLIENQDHFLIGMRGTAADEQTVHEVQNGGTPPPGTPNTPGRSKTIAGVGRSPSNASAGADSVRKYGGLRRNVSVSSRTSRQSNGAPSPASPAYGASLTSTTSASGVHRSNTVPSKRSPRLNTNNRLQKNSGSPSPTGRNRASPQRTPTQATAPQGLAPGVVPPSRSLIPSSLGAAPVTAENPSAVASRERLLGEQPEIATPTKERSVSNFFNRSPPTGGDAEKRPPNKLRKKRIPGSSNPSAQSSTQSLHTSHSTAVSPGLPPSHLTYQVAEHPRLETIPAQNPILSNTAATPPVETPRAEQKQQLPARLEGEHHSSDNTLKPITSPVSSLHSRSSFNDQSDLDHHYTSDSAVIAEQKEKRSKWRLSRHQHHVHTPSSTLSPRKGLGSDPGAGTSTSSVGSSGHARKSLTVDAIPAGSDHSLPGAHPQSSNESNSGLGASEEKKGPFGWLKSRMRDKKEENKDKDAEKGRNKSPPASVDRLRGKSMDLRRDQPPVPPLPAPSASFPISPVADAPVTPAPAPVATVVTPTNFASPLENVIAPQSGELQR